MTTLKTWGGNLSFTPRQIARPRTVEELAETVASSPSVTLHAALHSFSGVVATEEVALSLERLPSGIEAVGVDPDGRTRVRVTGSIAMRAALRALDEIGLALDNSGSNAAPTVLGAVGTAVHGSGVYWGSISHPAVVRRVELVDGRGDRRVFDASRSEDHRVLRGLRANLGALGVVVSVDLAARPAYRLLLDARTGSLAAGIDEGERTVPGRRFELLWYPGTDRAMRIYRDETELPLSPNRGFRAFLEEEVEGNLALGLALAAADLSPGDLIPPLRAYIASTFPEDRRDYVDTSWGGLTGYRRFRGLDLEHGFPVERLGAVLEALERLVADFEQHGRYVLDLPVNVRWSCSDGDTCMSAAHGRDTAWVDVACYAGRQDSGPFLRAVEALFFAHGGRPHLGKVGWENPEPSWDQAGWRHFREVQAELDPAGRFLNDHLRRLFGGKALDPGF